MVTNKDLEKFPFKDKDFIFRNEESIIKILFIYYLSFFKRNKDIFLNKIFSEDEVSQKEFDVVSKIIQNIDFIEKTISENLNHTWKWERLGTYEKAILSYAIYKLLIERKNDPSLIIYFSTEQAKIFTEVKASKFINGVLDSILKKELS